MPNSGAVVAFMLACLLKQSPHVWKKKRGGNCGLHQCVSAGQEYGDDQKMPANKYGSTLNNLSIWL